MKNNLTLAFIVAVIFLSAATTCDGQFINSRINLYIGYSAINFQGSKHARSGDFSHPALIANMGSTSGFFLKALYNTGNHISAGIQVDQSAASDWEFGAHDEYLGSEISTLSFSPVIQYHTQLRESGILTRLRGFVELAPVFGVLDVTLTHMTLEIKNANNTLAVPLSGSDSFYGFAISVGGEVSITQSIGFSCGYSYRYNRISSILFPDENFKTSAISLGMFIKIIKDKRYSYQ